jgi:hypothetical protein
MVLLVPSQGKLMVMLGSCNCSGHGKLLLISSAKAICMYSALVIPGWLVVLLASRSMSEY